MCLHTSQGWVTLSPSLTHTSTRTSWFSWVRCVPGSTYIVDILNILIQKCNNFPTSKPYPWVIPKIRGNDRWMTLMYKHQTLIVSLNFTKIINVFFKSDWLITMLFQAQQRCWSRNMSHLVKSGSAEHSTWAHTHKNTQTHTRHAKLKLHLNSQ